MPPLALVNSPDTGPGQYGYGWTVSGISVIDECHVGNGEFGYCLDGTPLVQVPAEQRSFDQDDGDPESISGLEEYRTYPDTGLRVSRVLEATTYDSNGFPNNLSRWKVESPSGRTSHFEHCEGTCIESMVSDSHGNYITINAHHDDARGVILEEIYYEGSLVTQEPQTGVVRFHENGIEMGERFYWFHRAPYEPCDEKEAGGANGCAPTTSGEADGSGYPLLSSVTVCAGDFPEDGTTPTEGCIPPTRFQYTKRPDRLEWTQFDHNTSIPSDPCHGPFFGDFDGDGKTDALWGSDACQSDDLYFWANGSSSSGVTSIADVPEDATVLIDDIDGDGSQDIVYFDEQAEVHTVSDIGGVPLYRSVAAGHQPGEFYQPVLADLNSDGLIDIVSCEGPADGEVGADRFSTKANRVFVYLGEVDWQGHRFAAPTSSLFDPVKDGSLAMWKTDGQYNEVGCEPGPMQVRHGFGGDIVILGRTGYFEGVDPTGGHPIGDLDEVVWNADYSEETHSHPWLGPSVDDQAPMPRAVQMVDGFVLERLPVRRPDQAVDAWSWHTDWPTMAVIPVSRDDGASKQLEVSIVDGSAGIRERRLKYFSDGFADPAANADVLPWLPELASSNVAAQFSVNGAYDSDGDGVDDDIKPWLLMSFFFDWNADGTPDWMYPLSEEEEYALVQNAETGGFSSVASKTGIPNLGSTLDDEPFPAQDDDDPELEIWQRTDWGDIRVYERAGFGKSMALASVEDGYGFRTEIGYSPAPSVHIQQSCPTPSRSVLQLHKPIVHCLENERQLVHTITEWGGDNGRRTRRYEYVSGAYNTATRRFLGFDRVIETEQLSSPAFPGDSSKIVRIRAFEDAESFPEPSRLGHALARRPDYELTLYIDDRVEYAGEISDRAVLIDHVWELDAHSRRFVEVERHEQVYELGHSSNPDAFRVPLPSIEVLNGLTPTYETSSYVDSTDAYGNVVDAHTVTGGETTSVHRTYSRVIESSFTAPEAAAIGSVIPSVPASDAPTRGRWRPSRVASETVTYADGEFVETDFTYTDEQALNTVSCSPHSQYDLACDQALALFPDSHARALGEIRTLAGGQDEQRRLFVYDPYGNVVMSRYSSHDGIEIEHHSHYDASRHIYRVGTHGPTGQPAFTTWNTLVDKPLAMVDAYGRETHFAYDGLGRLTARTMYGADGGQHAASVAVTVARESALDYGDDGLPTPSTERARSTSGDGRWNEVVAGAAGLPVEYRWRTSGPGGEAYSEVQYLQFELGRVYRASEPAFDGESQVWATVVYDASGRLIRQTQPDGSEFRTRYFPREEWQFDAEGNPPRRLTYDDFGRVVQARDPNNTVFCYTYDARSNLDRVRKGCSGNVWDEEVDFDFDVQGRIEQLTDPSSGTQTYDYDGRGRLLSVVDGNNGVHAWTYDALDRVVTETSDDGVRTSYYDSPSTLPAAVAAHLASTDERPGKLLAQTFDANGTISTNRYNQYGDVVQTVDVIDGQSYSQGISYNGDQRVDAIAYPSPGTDPMVVALGYNSVGQLDRVSDASREETLLQVLSRNARGQVTEVEHFGGASTHQGHDELGRVLERTTTLGATTTFDQEYAYTPNGNVESRWNHQSGIQETFGYDLLGRLTSSSLAGTWAYDNYGNSDDVTATPGGQLLSVAGVYSATYDDAGQLISYSDAEHALHVDWSADGEPEVIEGTEPCCSEMSPASAGMETVELFYGASGELIRRRATYAGDATVERDSVYVGAFEETTRNESDGTSVQVQRWSLPSVGGVSLTAVAESGDETGFAYHAGTSDPLGSVQSVITAEHDGTLQTASKSSEDARSYDPWGRARAETFGVGLPTFDNVNEGFTGHRAQHDGGLIDMNLRHYDPIVRRFISPDPVVAGVYDTQAWNRYAYVRNNPMRWVDPTGAYGQSPYGGGANIVAQYPYGGGALQVLAAAIASAVASGAIGRSLKTFGRMLRNLFATSNGSNGGGVSAPAAPVYTEAEPTVFEQFEQAARTEASRLRDAAASGISAVERAWDDPLGAAERGVKAYYGTVADGGAWYVDTAIDHFGGMAQGLWDLGGGLIDDPLGTSVRVGESIATGIRDDVVGTLETYPEVYEAVADGDLSRASGRYWEGVKSAHRTASSGVGGAGAAAKGAGLVKRGASALRNGSFASAAKGGGIVNRGGRFADLDKMKLAGEVGHHTPQNAFNRSIGLSRADGPALGMTTPDHALTRTFAGRGRRSMRLDAGASARDRLARDIRDVRRLFPDGKYDRGIREMLDYAKTLPEFQR